VQHTREPAPHEIVEVALDEGMVWLPAGDYDGATATVGPLVLGSAEVRSLVGTAPTVIYSTSKREVSLRVETLSEALELPDAIVQARAA
jgi:hypothetical protein